MKFTDAIENFVADWRRLGRMNSDRTEVAYRSRLVAHAEDVDNRDPAKTGREDIKRTLGRWAHPNTQRHAHAVLTAFYDWAMEEEIRQTNPARQVRRAKRREPAIARLSRGEVVALLDASMPVRRDRWAAHLALCAGLRVKALRGAQRRHFERPGFVWVSADIAKGGREVWVPVIDELAAVVEEILLALEPGEHVICARQVADPPRNSRFYEYPDRPASPKAIWEQIGKLGQRAGIARHINPHLLRHAFGDHVAKYAGLRAAQGMLGHVSVETTASTYVDRPTLDELAVSVHGFAYRRLSLDQEAAIPLEAPTGIEPVESVPDDPERDLSPDDQGGTDAPPDDGDARREA